MPLLTCPDAGPGICTLRPDLCTLCPDLCILCLWCYSSISQHKYSTCTHGGGTRVEGIQWGIATTSNNGKIFSSARGQLLIVTHAELLPGAKFKVCAGVSPEPPCSPHCFKTIITWVMAGCSVRVAQEMGNDYTFTIFNNLFAFLIYKYWIHNWLGHQ